MKARTSPPVDVVELSKLARSELLGFAAARLADLPVPVRITLAGAGVSARVRVIWHSGLQLPVSEPEPETAFGGEIVFDGEEVRAIALAVQADRVRAAELCAFCLRKLQDREFRVTEPVAMDGARAESGIPWSLDRVLRSLDLEARQIEYQVEYPRSQSPIPALEALERNQAVPVSPRANSSANQASLAPRQAPPGGHASRAA